MQAAELMTQYESVLWKFRLPRILLSLLVGAGLSVSGCAFQSLFSNPLATPDTLGVASGTSFGAALALLLGFGMLGVQAMALFFGIAAVALTYLAGSGKGRSSMGMMILSGIMVGSAFYGAHLAHQIHRGHRVAAAGHHLLAHGQYECGGV